MAHTNSTTNYALPQFIGSDKPAWLTDVNNAYSAIDTAIKNAATAASSAGTAAASAQNDATAAGNAASAAQTTATNASNTATANSSAITSLQSRCTALETAVTALNGYKHIVNSYTSGGWEIDEYNDGSIRQRFRGTVTFSSAASPLNNWYRAITNVTFPVPVVQATADCYGCSALAGRIFIPVVVNSNTTVECQLLSGATFSGGANVTNATIIIEGHKES